MSPGLIGQDDKVDFTSDTRLVVLHASVVDQKGKLVTSLQQDAFKVYENDVLQPLKRFLREDVPVSLGLVVDNSGSMRDKRKKVEQAAVNMIRASNPRDEVTIVNFNDEVYQDAEYTSDLKKMEEALSRLDARGGTAMRDAVSATIDYMKAKSKHDKKVMVVITDGNDTASTLTLERLVQKAHQTDGILLYFVGLLSEEEKREAKKAERALKELASASGGAAIFPKDIEEVDSATQNVAVEIRNQYMLAYSPVNQALDGSFRTVRVQVTGPGKPLVRTRSGYYANPEGRQKPPVGRLSQSGAPNK
jgi:VWFA-related protein